MGWWAGSQEAWEGEREVRRREVVLGMGQVGSLAQVGTLARTLARTLAALGIEGH